ncbi:hypothetical protein GCM10010151_56820 [Actinoallomurus spadix]|uniref:Uncharacterized protein n=1 Tax=Actinoallomurus spadix TaxID=79912 RepID=A0ABP3H448_9ACTN
MSRSVADEAAEAGTGEWPEVRRSGPPRKASAISSTAAIQPPRALSTTPPDSDLTDMNQGQPNLGRYVIGRSHSAQNLVLARDFSGRFTFFRDELR